VPNQARTAIFGLVVHVRRQERDEFRLDRLFDQVSSTGPKHIV
jgi:hypothetical protein